MNESPRWFKSSYSGTTSECVEVASHLSTAHVRDSKRPDGPHLDFSAPAFARFVTSVKDGHA
ncbi:hypothetical protein SLA_1588 [Streptomyces laurentii]|uniref:DUF397 domain-containing protein n=1 Tax=Streptomyces laurentii TaxID=39478 RepID=A0A160NWX8_STRLU|nr:hypothetical protein SLA_1588 [Streptomyces laurentii]